MTKYSIEKIYGKYALRKEDVTITVFDNGRHASKVCDLLNEQEEEIKQLNHLVKIATSLIEWNTIPQVRREWQKHLSKVGDVE